MRSPWSRGGVFTLLKVGVYIFGTGYLSTTHSSVWLCWVAAFTLIVSAIIAINKDDLKARLAYSTISQLAYVTLGVALANQMGIIGGAMQMVMHGMAKITLFMCAGAIYVATRKTRVSEMTGLGRQMPFTFAAFLIASFSIIGLPPLGGAWSKWFLLLAAADAQQIAMIAVLAIGSLLSVAYLLPVAGRAFFMPSRDLSAPIGIHEAPFLVVAPLCVTALGCILLFAFAARHLQFPPAHPVAAAGGCAMNRVIYILGASAWSLPVPICSAIATALSPLKTHRFSGVSFGFVSYVVIIFAARALRRLVLRPEDYYGSEAVDAEETEAHDV